MWMVYPHADRLDEAIRSPEPMATARLGDTPSIKADLYTFVERRCQLVTLTLTAASPTSP